MGDPPWVREDRFSDSLSRDKNQDELDRLIEEWTMKQDHYALMYLLQGEGVPAGPVIFEDDAYTDPQLRERGFFEELTHEECGTHLYPGLGFRLSGTPNNLRLPPVRLGEQNEYVYKQLLKVSDDEYMELEQEGHIGMDYAPEVL
jgi:crotonobetainyl-CoA:carnitine CoA-transferase CaiB-like acyl-CoA transferase